MTDSVMLRGGESSFLAEITPMIRTYNEEANIARTLSKLAWAKRVVVIDSGSTDGTLEVIRSFHQADVFHKTFNDFASQCNFGLEQIRSSWVLSLDADYELSHQLIEELKSLHPTEKTGGYLCRFLYCIYGKALRGSLYPPRIVLYRKEGAAYRNEGHTQLVKVSGEVLTLAGAIYHDDRKPLNHWLASQQGYALKEANYLLSADRSSLKSVDRLRLATWPAPFLVFIYTLFVKGCCLDGWRGWFYALQRLLAETMMALAILDRRLQDKSGAQRRR